MNSTHSADERKSIIGLIGRTPLIRMNRIRSLNPLVEIYAKAEWYNPGGSVKDRPALNIIRQAEKDGLLSSGKTILDATSGNTGIAYSMIGAAWGYPVTLCIPINASEERKRLLKAFGAHLVFTDPRQSSDGAILRARELFEANPGRYYYADQYNNPANWQAHYNTTGPEIWRQTGGRITHFVTGLGTTGTFMGVGRYMRAHHKQVQLISFQPDSPFHGLEGLKHMGSAIVPGIYDPELADAAMEIETEAAHTMVRRLAREEGILVGISAAAGLVAALSLAETITSGVVVTVFCDNGDRYLSDRLWDEGIGDPVI